MTLKPIYESIIFMILIVAAIVVFAYDSVRKDIRDIQTLKKQDVIVKVLNEQIEVDRQIVSQLKAPDNKLKAFTLLQVENPNDIKVINLTCNLLSDEDSYDCQGQFLFKNSKKLNFPIALKRNRIDKEEINNR